MLYVLYNWFYGKAPFQGQEVTQENIYLRQCTFKITANKSKRYLKAPILSS